MDELTCEILIVGAGPAGLSAGVYCARANRDVIILDGKELPALTQAKEIQNWPGEVEIKGKHLLEKFRTHTESYSENIRFIKDDVISLMLGMGINRTSTKTSNIISDVVIIATGRGIRKEIIKGEDKLLGFGVSYSVFSDGPSYKGKVVYLFGEDEEMLEGALILQQMGCLVGIITSVGIDELPEKVYQVKEYGIQVFENMEIIEIVSDSDGKIQKIICRSNFSDPENPDELKEFELSCLFILSHISSNSIFKKAGVELNDRGNIIVDEEQKTNLKGVFAAGDCTGGIFQVVFATAEGARAGINACRYLRHIKKE